MKNVSTKVWFSLLLVACYSILVGCSGSGSDDSSSDKVLVNAGADKVVDENTTVTLSGLAVGQTADLTYQWRASPLITITQDDTSVATASFIAPATTTALTYTLTLEVTDGDGNKGSDSLDAQVLPVNLTPVAIITASQFSGTANNVFPAGVQVVLDGTDSYDADSSDSSLAVSAYKWQQTAGEAVLSGISTEGDNLAFTTPILEEDNSLTLSLTVTDEEGAQATQTITLSIQSAAHTLPVVNAGLDHQVFSGELIILAGQASTSVPSSEPLTYRWLNDSQAAPDIDSTTQLQTFAVAPDVSFAQTITFTLAVTDAVGNVVEDALTVGVRPFLIRPLNDTGVIQQATDTAILGSQQNDYPGQDGQRGQDIIAANGQLDKAGRGEQGFDFTRLDAVGDEVDDPELDWACVRDNITGLIWEVKLPASSAALHSSAYTYSWYLSEAEDDASGTQSPTGANCSLTECNISAFVDAVNAQGLCHFNDWRVPTHQELLSLVHFGHASAPMIDTDYFPETSGDLAAPVWYWTSQSSADGAAGDISATAWAVDFATGNDNFLTKSTAVHIRLVRAGR